MSLEDLMKVEVESIYAASRHQQKVTEAPASITVITSDEIQKYGYRSLAEGVKVSYEEEAGPKGPKAVNVTKI